MDLKRISFFMSLDKLKNIDIFFKLNELQKQGYFLQSFKKLEKHEFNLWKQKKNSKT